uniref:Uncharacterized protein n=1 Tax=Anguilla anguilla TaxID=7936 RepID=A0A0E9S295_ANGAN
MREQLGGVMLIIILILMGELLLTINQIDGPLLKRSSCSR